MSKAALVVHEKIRTADDITVEFKVWRVSDPVHYPEGYRYSFFAIRGGVVLVGYDNHRPKGHHRHFANSEEAYEFAGLEKLRADFASDLERARKPRTRGE
jgi:hypothetical protein